MKRGPLPRWCTGADSRSKSPPARLAIAWLVLSPVLFRHGGLLRKNWLPLLGTGFLGNGDACFPVRHGPIPDRQFLSGMLNSLTPLMTLLAGVLLFGIRVRVIQLVGILLGLAGAIGLILVKRGRWTTGLVPLCRTADPGCRVLRHQWEHREDGTSTRCHPRPLRLWRSPSLARYASDLR
jgi:hypothetical protein